MKDHRWCFVSIWPFFSTPLVSFQGHFVFFSSFYFIFQWLPLSVVLLHLVFASLHTYATLLSFLWFFCSFFVVVLFVVIESPLAICVFLTSHYSRFPLCLFYCHFTSLLVILFTVVVIFYPFSLFLFASFITRSSVFIPSCDFCVILCHLVAILHFYSHFITSLLSLVCCSCDCFAYLYIFI